MSTPRTQSGFIGATVLVVIAFILLQFVFNIDIIHILQTPPVSTVSEYIVVHAINAWQWAVSTYNTVRS